MKSLQVVFLYILVLSEINQVLTSNNTEKKTISDDTSKPDDDKMCTNNKICIMKCCPFGKYVIITSGPKGSANRIKKCVSFKKVNDEPRLETDSFEYFSHPNLSIFKIKDGIFLENELFKNTSKNVVKLSVYKVYLTEKAELILETPNAYNRYAHYKNDKFCVEYKYLKSKNSFEARIFVQFNYKENKHSSTNIALMTTAMLISCFFLLVVLVVYGLLPELRNLCGMILMAYVFSQFGAFLLLAVIRLIEMYQKLCLPFTLLVYFFFLASFCWMNVMSYDIWWTFRGYAKARPIHRRGERFKFLMYCLYAWGLPLAMTIALGIISSSDMSDFPWFVKPMIPTNGCFISGGEKFYYLYIPMLFLIISNWMFYLMTAFNVWRLTRGTAVLDSAAAGTPQAHRTQRNRFMVYLKLSVVMGLNWVLEVVSFWYPDTNVWIVTDYYNLFIGLAIFLIFVCKPKIIKKLIKVIMKCKNSQWHSGQMSSTRSGSSSSDSSGSQETQTLQVCSNPKGPAYVMNNF